MSEYSRNLTPSPGPARSISASETQSQGQGPAAAGAVDLTTQLNQAYLAGDGAAVERIMALIAAAQEGTAKAA